MRDEAGASEKERAMTDPREALVALIPPPRAPEHVDHWPQDERDYYRHGDFSDWAERLEALDRMRREKVADAILAEFDVTPRGVHNHDIDPACPETRLPDGSLRDACTINVMTAFDSPHGMWCPPGCGHDRSEAAVTTGHDHKWQRRQNVTRRGYRMTPYEVCVVDGCGAARQVDKGLPDD